MDISTKIRVNISITEEIHEKMKDLASAKGVSVSQLVAILANEAVLPSEHNERRKWLRSIPLATLERIEQVAEGRHASPEHVLADWAWDAEVSYSNLRGQMSLF